MQGLESAIATVLAAKPDSVAEQLKPALKIVIGTANPKWISTAIRVFIDCCVTAAIWLRIWLAG